MGGLRAFTCMVLAVCLATAGTATVAFAAERDQKVRVLLGGWNPYPPYSYVETVNGFSRASGLDVRLLREIAHRAGYIVIGSEVTWADYVDDIRSGRRDIAPQVTPTPERAAFARFSIPYRTESAVLILPRGMAERLPADDEASLLRLIRETGFRLGVARGTSFPSAAFRAYLAGPARNDNVVVMEEGQMLDALLEGQIDGYLNDRIVAATQIEAMGVGRQVEEHPVRLEGHIHVMFSRLTVPPDVVDDFNHAIESVIADGTAARLNAEYTLPILVRLTLDSRWFHVIDLVGTTAFALSGLLLAIRYRYDIFGALVLAALPAVGGGVVRDLLLSRDKLAVLDSPIYLELVGGLVIGGFVIVRLASLLHHIEPCRVAIARIADRQRHLLGAVAVLDALGLAAFTVTGVVVALASRAEPLWLWGPIMAALTAAGGGILRDVVRSEPEVAMLKGELYPEIALVWGLVLALCLEWQAYQLNAFSIAVAIAGTVGGAFATRLAVMALGLTSPLPGGGWSAR